MCGTFKLGKLKAVEGVWDTNILYMEIHVKRIQTGEMFERPSLYLFYFDVLRTNQCSCYYSNTLLYIKCCYLKPRIQIQRRAHCYRAHSSVLVDRLVMTNLLCLPNH